MLERAADAARLLATGPTLLGPGWTCVDSLDDADDDLSDGEVEDIYVTLDLGDAIDAHALAAESKYQLIGMDTAMPFLKIGSQVFQGEITPLVGSELILGLVRNDDDPQHPTHPPRHLAAGRVSMRAVTLHAGRARAAGAGRGVGGPAVPHEGAGMAGDDVLLLDDGLPAREAPRGGVGLVRTAELARPEQGEQVAAEPSAAPVDGNAEAGPSRPAADAAAPSPSPEPLPLFDDDADAGGAPELRPGARRARVYARGSQPAVVRNMLELWAAKEQVERGLVHVVVAPDADPSLVADVLEVSRGRAGEGTGTGPISRAVALHLASARPLTGRGSRGSRGPRGGRGRAAARGSRGGARGRGRAVGGAADTGAGDGSDGDAPDAPNAPVAPDPLDALGALGPTDTVQDSVGASSRARGRGRGRPRGRARGRGGRGGPGVRAQAGPADLGAAQNTPPVAPTFDVDPMIALFYGDHPADGSDGAGGSGAGGAGGAGGAAADEHGGTG